MRKIHTVDRWVSKSGYAIVNVYSLEKEVSLAVKHVDVRRRNVGRHRKVSIIPRLLRYEMPAMDESALCGVANTCINIDVVNSEWNLQIRPQLNKFNVLVNSMGTSTTTRFL